MSYFTKEQEEEAVRLIFKECNFCGRNDAGSVMNMSYVERDKEGYVVGLIDLGLYRLSMAFIKDKDNRNSVRTPAAGISMMATRHWSMPPAIGYLTKLRKLTLYHCKGLPREIIHLSDSLQEIAFHFCEELDFDTLPPEFECLRQVTDFRIHGRKAIGRNEESIRILPIHRLRNFSNLRYLYYRGGHSSIVDDSINYEKEEIDFMLQRAIGIQSSPCANGRLIQDLLSKEVKFRKSLEILEIEGASLTEFTVASLFTEVLPQYPNLKRLILPNNKIRSLAQIIAQQPPRIPPTVRLRCLYLVGNPVLDKGTISSPVLSLNDPLLPFQAERLNLLQILSLYEEITSLGHGITESGLCTTKILLALDLNGGGRVLLSNRFKPIPLSVWPIVLERANRRKGYFESTNVLYHLLRNGPAMGKRQERATEPEPRFSSSPKTIGFGAEYALGCLSSALEASPIARFQPSSAFVIPNTTRKRKISIP